jgi:hypothetical protein
MSTKWANFQLYHDEKMLPVFQLGIENGGSRLWKKGTSAYQKLWKRTIYDSYFQLLTIKNVFQHYIFSSLHQCIYMTHCLYIFYYMYSFIWTTLLVLLISFKWKRFSIKFMFKFLLKYEFGRKKCQTFSKISECGKKAINVSYSTVAVVLCYYVALKHLLFIYF